MKSKIIAFVVLAVFVAAFSCYAAAPAKKPYKIGAVFDITGPGAPLGTPERDTAQMVVNQINKKGGINGHPIKLIIYDNASDETKCALAVKKLIDSDHVSAIIGPSSTGTTLAVVPICEKNKIPLISCAAGVKITQPVKPYVFKTAQSDIHAIAKVIDYLRSRGLKRVAFINDSNAFGTSGRDQMRLQAPKAGIKIVAEESFDSKDTDMTTQLTRIKAANPQAIVCWGTNPGPAIVARNKKALGIKVPLLMSHGISNRKFIELAGNAAEGVIFPSGKIIVASSIPDNDPQKKQLLAYAAQFKSVYGREADHFGGHAWDAIQLVLGAMKKVGDNPTKIRSVIENTKGFVGIGGVFNFSPKDHNGLSKDAFVMVQIRNGKWIPLK
jgi:branched-chain amino acid transport system substrate-binding protein